MSPVTKERKENPKINDQSNEENSNTEYENEADCESTRRVKDSGHLKKQSTKEDI